MMKTVSFRIFVYGTLMRGERAHHLLDSARYIGDYYLNDYAIYNLGSYPGIVYSEGDRVLGEVYEITEEMLPAMDRYEGEGSLYLRKSVVVSNNMETISVFAYIYNFRIEGEKKMRESWKNNDNNCDYVWYAAYGSNINYERFMEYISRCADTSAPAESRPYIFKHNMYFGGYSHLWDGAVAFLDEKSNGMAYGRIHKITRSQFEDVKRMEGSAYTNELLLEYIDGLPVYSFTSNNLMELEYTPSKSYIDVIFKGLVDTYSDTNPLVLQSYLYSRGFISDSTISVLAFIRNSEHAIKNCELCEMLSIDKNTVLSCVGELSRCGLVKLDRRSRGLNITNENALVFTNPYIRDLIDIMTMFRRFS